MVQLGVNSPEAQKEQELKKPGVLQETDAPIVLTMTAGPPVARARPKKTCCSTRTAVCISVLGGLVAVAIVGGTLGYLYMHARRCVDWGCFGMGEGRWNYYDDIVYPSEMENWFPSDESSSGTMGFREPYIYPGGDGDDAGPHAEPEDGGRGRHGGGQGGGQGGRHHGGRGGGRHGGHSDHDGDHDDHDGGHDDRHDGMPGGGSMPPPPPVPMA